MEEWERRREAEREREGEEGIRREKRTKVPSAHASGTRVLLGHAAPALSESTSTHVPT
jgi:hypothetical protein